MTCIAAIVDKKTVYIGGDSAGVAGLNLRVREDKKVFINGDYIIGFTSSFRMGQLLQYAKLPEIPKEENLDLHRFMCTDFQDALRKLYKEKGFLERENDVESGGTFIIGVRGKLFIVEDDFQVAIPSDNFSAVGCGEAYALGSLYATEGTQMKPEQRLKLALETAEHFSAGVRKPFTIKSLKV